MKIRAALLFFFNLPFPMFVYNFLFFICSQSVHVLARSSSPLSVEKWKIWEEFLPILPANSSLKITCSCILVSVQMYIRAEEEVTLIILYLAVRGENRKEAWIYIGNCALNAAFKEMCSPYPCY